MGQDLDTAYDVDATTLDVERALESYRANGFLILRGAVRGEQLARLAAELETIQQAVESGLWRGNHLFEDTGLARVIFGPYDHSRALREVVDQPTFVELASRMLGGPIHLHHTKLMCKVAVKGTPQPPHQDYHYWQGRKANQVAVFVCIDPSTEANGCLHVCAGSHKLGLLEHHEQFHPVTNERHWVCTISPELRAADVAFVGEPGDVVFFDSLTIHYSAGNRSTQHRRGVIFEYDELGNLPPQVGWGAPQPPVQWP